MGWTRWGRTGALVAFVSAILLAQQGWMSAPRAAGRTAGGNDQDKAPAASQEWNGSVEQKVAGLMTVWAEAKFNFPFFDERPGLNWDERVKEYIPRVIAAPDLDSYYLVLREFAALLKDGHTAVYSPGWPFPKGTDRPPIELQVVEGKFLVARAGDTDEIARQHIRRGLEIVEIDGVPIRRYFTERVLRYESRGTAQADDGIELWFILLGPKGSRVPLTVRSGDGAPRSVTVTRDSTTRAGSSFQWRLLEWSSAKPPVEARMLDGGILYVRIANFEDEKLVETFDQVVAAADWSKARGLIIDLRFNIGGESTLANAIQSRLVTRSIKNAIWKSPKYVPAHRSWNYEPEWEKGTVGPAMIEPGTKHTYAGPVAVLVGPSTFSSAEDFLVPLHAAGRVTLVGERTAGSTGNPLRVPLPGGGAFRVVTLKSTYPDGRAFVGVGIPPDVPVAPTQVDIAEGRDPALAKAVEVVLAKRRP